ncbi:T9SS type A sorting domain-containing protein [Aureispira anguillae]|nr:T9SS type A sorting domain-containing protein [Aureispira anguillae]
MKTHLIYLFLFFASAFLQAQDTTKVLFIGNSITYFNNMPFTFEAIANSLGDTTAVTMYAPGGTGFLNHVGDANVYNHFRQEEWDYVVLQPGSGDSGGAAVGGTPVGTTVQRINILLDSIYVHSPCAKVLFYEISNGVTGNTTAALTNYNAIMDLIKSNVEYFSDSTALGFAPVGEAFRTAWNNNPNDLLWGSYGDIHPNAKGSYLAACVFYASIFQKPSTGTTISNTLTALEASSFQQLADTLVLNNLSDWRIGTYDQFTDFNYILTNNSVNFNNGSQNIDSLVWDFGDLTTSTDWNPTHNYLSIGSYPVTLTTYQNGCAQTISQTVVIGTLADHRIEREDDWNIYPNPTHNFLQLALKNKSDDFSFEVYNHTGQLVMKTKETRIDVSSLLSGIYILKIINTETLECSSKKWLKY